MKKKAPRYLKKKKALRLSYDELVALQEQLPSSDRGPFDSLSRSEQHNLALLILLRRRVTQTIKDLQDEFVKEFVENLNKDKVG